MILYRRSKLEICIGIDDAESSLGGSSRDRHELSMKDDISERQERGSRRLIDDVCSRNDWHKVFSKEHVYQESTGEEVVFSCHLASLLGRYNP